MKNPIQPLVKDEHNVLRFKQNKIVTDLLNFAQEKGFGLNEIASREYDVEDREQLAQLIGYSLSGFSDLSFVKYETYNTASNMHEHGLDERDARIQYLEDTLNSIRNGLKEAVTSAFNVHPDDLVV